MIGFVQTLLQAPISLKFATSFPTIFTTVVNDSITISLKYVELKAMFTP